MPSIREVMTKDPITMPSSTSATEAARAMRESDVGNILLYDDDQLTGILTDRDIAIRVVAEGQDPNNVNVGDIATKGVQTLSPDDEVGDAIRLMKESAVRRVPIVEGSRPVGIVSLGDLAEQFDPSSALGQISDAPPTG